MYLDLTTHRSRITDLAELLRAGQLSPVVSDEPVTCLRVGFATSVLEGAHPGVALAVRAALRALERLGALVVPVRMPADLLTRADAVVLAECDVSAARQLAGYAEDAELREWARGEQPGAEVAYKRALADRAKLQRDVLDGVLAQADVLVMPTIPSQAPSLEAARAGAVDDFSRLTWPFNVLGFPALSVPCGFSPDGLPFGLQIAGRPFDESTVLRVGHAHELATSLGRLLRTTTKERRLPSATGEQEGAPRPIERALAFEAPGSRMGNLTTGGVHP
jgi:aspartyl-tRNA(Asn)/glutamyl-tRNA(Gln) amidotransferase subunit A